MNNEKLKVQAHLTGDAATVFLDEQKKFQESQPVTLRRILLRYKKMKDNGCKAD